MPEKIPYRRWETILPTRCDFCGAATRVLYQIPDGTPDGEEDSACEKCARGRMPKKQPKPPPPEPDDPRFLRKCTLCSRVRNWTEPVCKCGCPEFELPKKEEVTP